MWILLEMFVWQKSTFIVNRNCKSICLFFYDKLKRPQQKRVKKKPTKSYSMFKIVCDVGFFFFLLSHRNWILALRPFKTLSRFFVKRFRKINRKHVKHKNWFQKPETIQQTTWKLSIGDYLRLKRDFISAVGNWEHKKK